MGRKKSKKVAKKQDWRWTPRNMKKAYLFALVLSLIASAAVAVFIFLLGTFGEVELRLLLTTLAVGIFSLAGLASTALSGNKKHDLFVFFGVVASIAGFVTAAGLIWEVLTGETWGKTFLILAVMSYAAAHTSLLLLIDSKKKIVIHARSATIGFVTVVALMLIYLVFASGDGIDESFFRFLGAFAVLDVLGTVVTPLLRRYYAK